ncbi:MAG TPA: beta-propeller domain-containing protein [Candidatus Angelobacter sp.]|nr:beta-propeller domain-containing protein [Candidatus Angelobacter sp.]
MRPRAKVAFLILLTAGGILPMSLIISTPSAHGMVRFSSYQDLEHFLLTRSNCGPVYTTQYDRQVNSFGSQNRGPAFPAALGAAGTNSQTSSPNSAPTHSATNNQVSGVDELDMVKTDGQYIYTVSNNTVAIVYAYPVASAQLVSRISILNQTIDGIFLSGNKLSIVSEAPRTVYSTYGACGISLFEGAPMRIAYPSPLYSPIRPQLQNTSVSVYDLTDRASPLLQTTITVNGTFVGARQIGTFAYLVTSTPAWTNQTLPITVVNGRQLRTVATQVYHSDVSDRAFSYTSILALDTNQNNPAPTVETYLLGTSSTIYVSLTNLFLTQPIWDGQSGTVLHRISVSGSTIKYEATGTVPGHVLNQYSMDENQGYFRAATSSSGFGSSLETNVYVLNENLETVGRLEGLSPGEIFYAARFMGDRGYLVTYHNTDPLYVLDLHNPSSPTVLGSLIVAGYSDFLQPYDQTHLIGIGKVGVHTTVKVSLFNVTDPTNPVETATYTVPSWYSDSPALKDPKAVLFDKTNSLLVIPVDGSQYTYYQASSTSTGQCSTDSSAYVFNVTSTNLALRGTVTQQMLDNPLSCSSEYKISRELFIGGVIYTISAAIVKMNSLTDLSELGSVSLA